jgi:hypothetical protein
VMRMASPVQPICEVTLSALSRWAPEAKAPHSTPLQSLPALRCKQARTRLDGQGRSFAPQPPEGRTEQQAAERLHQSAVFSGVSANGMAGRLDVSPRTATGRFAHGHDAAMLGTVFGGTPRAHRPIHRVAPGARSRSTLLANHLGGVMPQRLAGEEPDVDADGLRTSHSPPRSPFS